MKSKNTIIGIVIILVLGLAYYFYHINSAEYKLTKIIQKTCDSNHIPDATCNALIIKSIKQFNSIVNRCESIRNDGRCEERMLEELKRNMR